MNIRKVFVFLTCFLLFISCKKFLSENPRTFLSPTNFYNNLEECNIAVTGCYDLLGSPSIQAANYYGGYYIGAIMTDEMEWSSANADNFREISFAQHSSNNQRIYDLWQGSYVIINNCNNVIKGLEAAPIDETSRKRLLGEVRFIRALFYFNLVNLFGDVPLLLEPSVSADGNFVARTPASEVFDAIIDDLQFSEANLPISPPLIGKVTKGAAKMLLAKVYMQMAGYPYNDEPKWQLAYDKCKELLEGAGYGYTLQSDYAEIFALENENNSEVVFDVQFEQGTEGSTLGFYFWGFSGHFSYGGSGAFALLIPKYSMSFADGDLRRDHVVGDFSINANGVSAPIGIRNWRNAKYRLGYPNTQPLNQKPLNFIVLRYADLLLMFAEASLNVKGVTPESYEYINKVRRRAYGKPVDIPDVTIDLHGMDEAGLLDAIVLERSLELGGEGWRWFDLKRWKLLVDKVKNATYNNISPVAASSISDKHYFLPIPLNETRINPALIPTDGW